MMVSHLRFRALPGGQGAVIVIFCGFAVVGISILVGMAATMNLFTWLGLFPALWFLLMAWNGYWFLSKISSELRFDGEVLLARSVLSERRISVDELLAVRPFKLGPVFVVFELSDGSRVMAAGGNGLGGFANAISEKRPHLPVRIGPFVRDLNFPLIYNGLKLMDGPLPN